MMDVRLLFLLILLLVPLSFYTLYYAVHVTSLETSLMATFKSLPPELLLLIAEHLPSSARLSLRLSNKRFYLCLPGTNNTTKSPPRSACEAETLTRVITERALLARNQRRCILCNGVQSTDFFIADTPICKWHEGWFLYRCIPADIMPALQAELRKECCSRGEAGEGEEGERWIAVKRTYCAHERNILSWHVGECCCGCQSCGWWEVTCWIRVSPGSREVEDLVRFSEPVVEDVRSTTAMMMISSQWRIRSPGPWIQLEEEQRC